MKTLDDQAGRVAVTQTGADASSPAVLRCWSFSSPAEAEKQRAEFEGELSVPDRAKLDAAINARK